MLSEKSDMLKEYVYLFFIIKKNLYDFFSSDLKLLFDGRENGEVGRDYSWQDKKLKKTPDFIIKLIIYNNHPLLDILYMLHNVLIFNEKQNNPSVQGGSTRLVLAK